SSCDIHRPRMGEECFHDRIGSQPSQGVSDPLHPGEQPERPVWGGRASLFPNEGGPGLSCGPPQTAARQRRTVVPDVGGLDPCPYNKQGDKSHRPAGQPPPPCEFRSVRPRPPIDDGASTLCCLRCGG